MICIPRSTANKFKEAIKNGDISIPKLYEMTPEESHDLFAEFVGEKFATALNAQFQRAIISTRTDALASYVEKLKNVMSPKMKEQVRNMYAKIQKNSEFLTQANIDRFLSDLTETTLGIKVSEEEMNTMIELKDTAENLKTEIDPESPAGSPERLAYGYAIDNFKNYVGELKLESQKKTAKEYLATWSLPKNVLTDLGNTTKALLSTLDNSLFGRQVIGNFFDWKTNKIWRKNFIQSFKDIGKQLVAKTPKQYQGFWKNLFTPQDDVVMRAVRADIFSRPNALNGKYNIPKNKFALNVNAEEAFPTTFPEKIPLIGRAFKASEAAFSGGAMRMRADLADMMIREAEKNGIDTTDPDEMNGIGELVGDMTGRGDIGKLAVSAKEINALMFSVRFLKSQIDKLIAIPKSVPAYARKVQGKSIPGDYAKRQAANHVLRIVVTMAVVLGIAKAIDPDSVDFDPRSGRLGKIRINGKDHDISGGFASLVTLASRVLPTSHDGKWGFWYQNPNTKVWTKLNEAKYGQRNTLEVAQDFLTGKASPMLHAVMDIWKGRDFQGRRPNIGTVAEGLTVPIGIQQLANLKDSEFADVLQVALSEFLGIGVGIPTKPKKK